MDDTVSSRPRIAVGSLTFEGNSFSNVITDLDQFRRCYLLEGEEVLASLAGTRDAVAGAIRALQGAECVPLVAADAGAGGRVATAAYDDLKQRLLDHLHAAMPLDGVYLALHGAMITEDLDDAEGDLLAAVRRVVGADVVIAVSCDLHADITPAMTACANILVGYKLYPHDDAFEAGERAGRLLLDAARGLTRPRTHLAKIGALFPVPAQLTADPFPLSALRQSAEALERAGDVLAASYFPVHPWLDIPDAGFAAAVVSDNDPEGGERHARELCLMAWDRRHQLETPAVAPAEAIRTAPRGQGVVLLADVADCVGGGAPGTSAEAIEALWLHARNARSAAVIAAPAAVARAYQAGAGASVAVEIGERGYGPVVPVTALVERLLDGRFAYSGGPLGGVEANLGPSAVLRVGNLQILVTTHAAYEYGDEQFRAGGIDIQACDFAVVKNPVNARFAIPNAAFIVLDTVGPTTPRLAGLPWQRLTRPCFPMEDAPAPFWRPANISTSDLESLA